MATRPPLAAVAAVAAVATVALLATCGKDPPPGSQLDAGTAAGHDTAGEETAGTETAGGETAGDDDALAAETASGDGAAAAFDPGPEPTQRMRPQLGELMIVQMALSGMAGITGEAGLVVGPDGTIVVVDVGNDSHDDDLRAAIKHLNTVELTPARGYPARTPLQVEWVILTHFHVDHIGGFDDLITTSKEPLTIVHGIVHRGLVDLGDGVSEGDWGEVCAALQGPLAALDRPLCVAKTSAKADCGDPAAQAHRPASGCPGLMVGDLADPGDDGDGEASWIGLGSGARMLLVGASAHIGDGTEVEAMAPFGHDDGDHENARSVVASVQHGDFRYQLGGDLTGGGKGSPDVESLVVARAGAWLWQKLGVDVTHIHHHGSHTSSNAGYVAAVAPADGRSRNAIIGINDGYVGFPKDDTVARWLANKRLGGGSVWVTQDPWGGADDDDFAGLRYAKGDVIVQTIAAGAGYRVQAAGGKLASKAFESVR